MRLSSHFQLPANWPIGLATAAILLVPYATITLSFRRALEVQAAAILGITLLLAASGLFTKSGLVSGSAQGKRRLLERLDLRSALSLGALLWAIATLLGGFIGFVHGNGISQVIGQCLSLALLPLGFFAGRLTRQGERPWKTFRWAVIVAVSAAAAAHLAHWLLSTLTGPAPQRLFFNNGVSVAGAAPLAILLLAGIAPRQSFGVWLRRAVFALLILFLIGTSVRGAWVTVAFGLLLLALFRWNRRSAALWRWLAAGALLIAMALAFLHLEKWLALPRSSILPETNPVALQLLQPSGSGFRVLPESLAKPVLSWNPETHPKNSVLTPFSIATDRTYRLRAWCRGGDSGHAYVELVWLDKDDAKVGAITVSAWPSENWVAWEAIGRAPATAERVELSLTGALDSEGIWSLRQIELHDLGPAHRAPWLRQGAYLIARLGSLRNPWATQKGNEHQNSVQYRVEESRQVFSQWKSSRFLEKVFGQGLGATFEIQGEEKNYIHNFYLFLLFKLGVLGSLLVGAALLLWLRTLMRISLAERTGRPGLPLGRQFPVSALVAWIVYLLWSLTSPEILDFRLAPLWGLLLAVTPLAASRTATRPSENNAESSEA